jgi:hypothetical protein
MNPDTAAKKYARQFRNGRPWDSLESYARADFLAGYAAAQASGPKPDLAPAWYCEEKEAPKP